MNRCARKRVRDQRLSCRNLSDRLQRLRPQNLLRQRRELLSLADRRLLEQAHHRLNESKHRLAALDARLRLLGPEQVLARGYSVTLCVQTGNVVRDAQQVQAGQEIETRLKHGVLFSTVRPPAHP
jgi:exodeoxyribonuclease VII large subunit